MSNKKIIETGKKFGHMNMSARFFPEEMSAEERAKIFLERRLKVGEEFGFDGHKMFMADQALKLSGKRGSYFEITDDYVMSNPKGWTDIAEDILIITDRVPGVVIGHPVADCPVVMMSDKRQGVSAIAHCSCDLIDARLPMMVADALLDAYNSKDDDLEVYVSACAGPGWTYDSMPKWAKDRELWSDAITCDEDGMFHIDLRRVVKRQLQERNIDDVAVLFNMDDTISNPNYYSNSQGRSNPEKFGRHFAGLFYEEDSKGRGRR